MIIQPLKNQVFIKLDDVKAGVLDVSSRSTAVESAEVVAIGPGVSDEPWGHLLKVGDRVFVKSWAIDSVSYKGQIYCFINLETNGILAIFKEDE